MQLCPCGSSRAYDSCCGLYIDQALLPENPEQLMRSRYTAFSLGNWDYLKNTMQGKALAAFREGENVSKMLWTGLEIRHFFQEGDSGGVEFIAKYLKNNSIYFIHEKSEFRREAGKWLYVDGIHFPAAREKLSRNQPCPCGSLKKFKNCHG